MKGAYPHAAGVDRRQRRQPGEHLLGSLVREGYGKDRKRCRLTRREKPGDTSSEHARFAAACTRKDQRRGVRQGHRRELLGVEIFQKRRIHEEERKQM